MRTEYFEYLGFIVLRFTNKQVAQEFSEIIGTITAWVAHLRATDALPSDPLRPSGPPPTTGEEMGPYEQPAG